MEVVLDGGYPDGICLAGSCPSRSFLGKKIGVVLGVYFRLTLV